MSVQIKYELTEIEANMANNLAIQFKRDEKEKSNALKKGGHFL